MLHNWLLLFINNTTYPSNINNYYNRVFSCIILTISVVMYWNNNQFKLCMIQHYYYIMLYNNNLYNT
jgi:hypothetical protein